MARLTLFGRPALVADGGMLSGRAAQRHRLALLALLAVAPGNALSRDKVIACLWPEHATAAARHLLSVTLHVLRRALGADALLSAADGMLLDTTRVDIDVVRFETALEHGDAAAAVQLYRGPFLDGFFLRGSLEFERWLDDERDRLANACLEALELLARQAERDGDIARAVHWWRRLAAQDPCNGRVALALVTALAAAGDSAGAIRHARAHTVLLRTRFGLEPADALVTLAGRRLR
jgi:DNA-binding SARP family transcriptional activator